MTPRTTEAEKAVRGRAVQEAFKQAARVPFGDIVVAKSNPNAASDGAAGVLAARMAVRTAVYNVRINLGSIGEEAFKSELGPEADRLEAEAERQERIILAQLKI